MASQVGGPVGRTVQVPSGAVEEILEWDVMRDAIRTASGQWNVEDLVPLLAPTDAASLEAWMDGPDYRIHRRATYDNVATRCGSRPAGDFKAAGRCKCEFCYRAVITNRATGEMIKDKHWRDNETCQCHTNGCHCAQ